MECVVKMCCEDVPMSMCMCMCWLVLAWCLVLGAPSVVVMAGCVLVCSTSGRGRKHCKQEMAANASLCVIAQGRALRTGCCLHYASHSDDGWLCACLQSFWKGKNPLQARGPANSTLCRSCIAVQMSFVALELLLGPLLAGMMAGCVLVCSSCWSGRVHCLA